MNKVGKKPWGSRTIKLSIHFWTDQLPDASNVDEKTAWLWGTIHLPRNKARGIGSDMVHFRGRRELIEKMQKILDGNKIKLVPPARQVKFGKIDED